MQPDARTTGPTDDVHAAEKAVLGSAIQSARLADLAAATLTPGSFAEPAHAAVFQAACDLAGQGSPVDPQAVMHQLTTTGDLARVGGGAYVVDLVGHAATGDGNLRYHVTTVHAAATRRGARAALAHAQQRVDDPSWDPLTGREAVMGALETALAVDNADSASTLRSFGAALTDTFDAIEHGPRGLVPTGYIDLDRVLKITPGKLVVLGAATSVGKSTFAAGIARHVALHRRRPVLLSTMEMTHIEVTRMALAAEAQILAYHLDSPSEQEWDRLAQLRQRHADAPLWTDDNPAQSVAHLHARLRYLNRIGQLPALVVVDYLQLMDTDADEETRERQVAALARDLKVLAGRFDVAVLALAQLNRNVEHRRDHAPTLADLRESGSIEQSADAVLLLHREERYDPETPRAGEADIILAKNRGGATATMTVASQLHYQRFVDMAAPDGGRPRPYLTPISN